MKRNILIFGLIAGALVSSFMVFSMGEACSSADFEGSMILGYTAMIVAFSLIFVAVKNYRDKYNGGIISFAKALKIGLWIALIASTMYVITWAIDYHFFVPDFMDQYTTHLVEKARESGATETEIEQQVAEMKKYQEMYKNPIWFALFTYSEILPVGILMSLIAALVFKRKTRKKEEDLVTA